MRTFALKTQLKRKLAAYYNRKRGFGVCARASRKGKFVSICGNFPSGIGRLFSALGRVCFAFLMMKLRANISTSLSLARFARVALWSAGVLTIVLFSYGIIPAPAGNFFETKKASAAIGFDASSTWKNQASTTKTSANSISTTTFITTGGSNYVLIATVQSFDTSATDKVVSGITVGNPDCTTGNSNMTLSTTTVTGSVRTEIWYLVNPTTNADRCVTANFGGIVTQSSIAVVALTGVDQSTPIDAKKSANGSSQTPSLTITTATNNAWVIDAMVAGGNGAATVGGGQNQITNLSAGNSHRAGTSYVGPISPAGSNQTMSWSIVTSKDWATAAVALKPAAESFTVGGNAYENDGTAALEACDSSTPNISLVVASSTTALGSKYSVSCDNSSGAFSFSAMNPVDASTTLIVYIDGVASTYGASILIYSGSGNVTGFNIRGSTTIVQHSSDGPVRPRDLDMYDNDMDADLPYVVTASQGLTFEQDVRFIVGAGDKFLATSTASTTPGGTFAKGGDVVIESGATLDMSTYSLTVGGNLMNHGTFTSASGGVVIFNGTRGGGNSFDFGSGSVMGLTINGAAITASTSIDVAETLTVNASKTLTVRSGYYLSANSGSTVTLSGTINGTGTTSFSGGVTIPTSGTLSSNVRVNVANSDSTVPARTYGANLELVNLDASATRNITLGAGTITVSGNLHIRGDLSNTLNVLGTPNYPTLNVSGNALLGTAVGVSPDEYIYTGTGTWTFSGNVDVLGATVYASSSHTFVMDGTSKTFSSGGSGFDNMTFSGSVNLLSNASSTGNVTLSGTVTGGYSFILNGASKTLNPGSNAVRGLMVNGSYTLSSNDLTVGTTTFTPNSSFTVDTGRIMTATSTMILNTSSGLTGNGTTTFGTSAYSCANATSTGATGSIGTNVQLDATAGNCHLPYGIFSKNVEVYSNSASAARTVEMMDGWIDIRGNLYVNAANSQNITLSGTANNPSITVNNLNFFGAGGGSKIIQSGTGGWEAYGNVALSGGTFTATAGHRFIITGSGATFDSGGNSLYDFQVATTTSGGTVGSTTITTSDLSVSNLLAIYGSLEVGNGRVLTSGTGGTINLTGTLHGAGTTTIQNSTLGGLGVVNANIRFDASNSSLEMSSRTFGGNVEIYNGSANNVVVTMRVPALSTGSLIFSQLYSSTTAPEYDWTNPSFATSSNNNYATVDNSGFNGITSETLFATSSTVSIPSGATIYGVKIEIEKRMANAVSDKIDSRVSLVKAGVITSTNRAEKLQYATSDRYSIYGGDTDLWGLSLAPLDINAVNFGAAFSTVCANGQYCPITANEVRVDHIGATVYYSGSQAGTTTVSGHLILNAAGAGNIALSATSTSQRLQAATTTFIGAAAGQEQLYMGTSTWTFTRDLDISNGLFVATTSTTTIAGNFTNSGGTFTHNNGTVVLNGDAQQTVTGNATGTSAFYNLTITNNSGTNGTTSPSVIFTDAASTTNLFTISTASVKVRFAAGKNYTFQNVSWNGAAAGTRIMFRSSSSGSQYFLYIPGTQFDVSYIDFMDASACNSSTIVASNGTNADSGNNSCISFGTTVLTLRNYQWWGNDNAVQPLSPKDGLNTAISTVDSGGLVRLRIDVAVSSSALTAEAQKFVLQYKLLGSGCSAAESWSLVGNATSSEAWRFYDNAGPSDGNAITTALLDSTNILGTYEEIITFTNPSAISAGLAGEWDLSLYNGGGTAGATYCFRAAKTDGSSISALDAYTNYPQLTIVAVTLGSGGGATGFVAPSETPATGATTQSGGGGTEGGDGGGSGTTGGTGSGGGEGSP